MKILLALAAALMLQGCSKDASAEDHAHDHDHAACKCQVKLSAPVWRFGTLCQAGEVTQGHGVNKDGQVVSGCMKIDHVCEEPKQ